MTTSPKSPIVEALEKRRRKVHTFPAPFGSDGTSNGLVAIRVPSIGEEIAARVNAPIWLEKHGAIDFSAETDLESMYIVCAAWRDEKDPENGIACPLPDMLRVRMSADEVQTMVGYVSEVKRRESPFRESITELECAGYVEAIGETDDDHAHELLLSLDREALTDLAVMACRKLHAFTSEPTTCSWCDKPATATGADGTRSCGQGQGDGLTPHNTTGVLYSPIARP